MFKRLTEITRSPGSDAMALRELEDAKRALLEAQSALEYTAAMVGYHSKRVVRLKAYTGGTP